MEYHRYSTIWPLMQGVDFEKLKADIKANGLRMNLIVYQGKILDGRNRERACEAVGVTPRYSDAGACNDDAALKLVVSLNEHRRHMSVAQRAFAAEKLATLQHGSNQYEKRVERAQARSIKSETRTMRDAADLIGVSYGSVARARSIRLHGNDDDVAAVVSGRTGLKERAEKLRGKAKQQPRSSPVAVLRPIDRPRLEDVLLTPEQVDPEFTGTKVEFIDKYGHVHAQTAEKRARTRFDSWASNFKVMAREAKRLPDWPEVDHNWLRDPNPYGVSKLTEALEYLRPKIAEAEALLACAVVAAKKKQAS